MPAELLPASEIILAALRKEAWRRLSLCTSEQQLRFFQIWRKRYDELDVIAVMSIQDLKDSLELLRRTIRRDESEAAKQSNAK